MYLSTCSSRLLLYDTNSWYLKKTYACVDGVIRDISWSDDGKYMLQVNSNGLVEVLTAADHDVRSLQHIPLKDTWSASFHRDGHRNIAIGSKSGSVLIWDTINKTVNKTFSTPSQQSSVNYISYNSQNTSLAATMQNGDTVIYELASNIPVLTVKLSYSRSISAMKFHHESSSLLGLVTDEGHVLLRDITTNKDKVLFEHIHKTPVSDLAFSLINKDIMFSSGYDKVVHIYDIRLQNVVSSIHTSYYLTSLAVNIHNQMALGTKNGVALVYDLRDLSKPQKVLMGHEEEVCKVAFQPLRKKVSTEVSLREDTESNLSPININSPVHNSSDVLIVSDTPPKGNLDVSPQENKPDSFLVLMGPDKSHDFDDGNKSTENEKKSFETELSKLNIEKGISNNVSTSIAIPHIIVENFSPSPICAANGMSDENVSTHIAIPRIIVEDYSPSPICAANGIPDDGQGSNRNVSKDNPNINETSKALDSKMVEELKDFIKFSLFDVTNDDENHFCSILMELTKQKLYLKKQLAGINEQIHNLAQNQNTLIYMNRKLLLEIEQLKAQNNLV